MDLRFYANKKGMITLLSVIIVSAVAVTITVSMLLLSVGSSKTGIITQKSWESKSLANACAEEALQQVRDNIQYLENREMTFVQGKCNYEITQTGEYTREIRAWGTVDDTIIRRLLIQIDVNPLYPVINIDFWQEVPLYDAVRYFTITTSVGSNGTMIPAENTVLVPENKDQTFTFTPNAGYEIDQVLVDGAPVSIIGNSYTIGAVQSDMNISITFKALLVYYTVTASSGTNGFISPSGAITVVQGGSQEFTFTPNGGYTIDQVKVNESVVPVAGNTYTLSNLQANQTISVTYKVAPTYTITASAGSNGSISPFGTMTVAEGSSKTFTFTPSSGCEIDQVKIGGSVVAISGNTYTISNIQSNTTISVTFIKSCVGVKKWTSSDKWKSYKIGDLRTDGNPLYLYECIDTWYSDYQPSSSYGYYGWKKLNACQ